MRKLFTIGYEGTELNDFLKVLIDAKVTLLLDVREIPISRRKGFSKTALGQSLEQHGITYRHEKQLGSPKTIRHRLREDGNYPRFFRDFERHLNKQSDLLETLADELKGNVALMCYERDHKGCHRHSVADALAELLDKKPIHLGVDTDARKAQSTPYPDFGQGLSPA